MEPMQTGVNVEAAAQPDLNTQQPVQEQQQEQLVPVAALQAERRERQQLQENLKVMQDHLALLQANQPKQPQADEFSGKTDEDVITVGEAKKFINQFSQQQKLAVEELKMAQSYPDYNDVVRKYLPDVLKTDPDLKEMIMSAPNPYKAAYHLAKRSDTYLQDHRAQNRSPQAQQAVQNLQKPGNLSSIGGATSGVTGEAYKTMSDKDFMSLAARNMG